VSFAIIATGVRASEWARNAFTSAAVHSRRAIFFVFFGMEEAPNLRAGLLAGETPHFNGDIG
jgi:hypothetical protein